MVSIQISPVVPVTVLYKAILPTMDPHILNHLETHGFCHVHRVHFNLYFILFLDTFVTMPQK